MFKMGCPDEDFKKFFLKKLKIEDKVSEWLLRLFDDAIEKGNF